MYSTNRITRKRVEDKLIRHKKSITELKALQKKGLIDENTMLYTLEDVIQLMYDAAVGHWANCQCQKNPKSIHSDRQGTVLAKRFIKMAFVKSNK